jgi:hypothetical protein
MEAFKLYGGICSWWGVPLLQPGLLPLILCSSPSVLLSLPTSHQPVTHPLSLCCRSANPLTITNALATSKAKLIQHGWGILGAVAAVGAVLLLGRGRIFGRRRRGGDDEDDGGSRRTGDGGGGGGSGQWGRGSSVAPMAAEKQRAERLAVRWVVPRYWACLLRLGRCAHCAVLCCAGGAVWQCCRC